MAIHWRSIREAFSFPKLWPRILAFRTPRMLSAVSSHHATWELLCRVLILAGVLLVLGIFSWELFNV